MLTTAEKNINALTLSTADGFLAGHTPDGAAKRWDTKDFRRNRSAGIRSLTSTAYNFLSSDEGQFIAHNSASASILTILEDASLDWPVGGGADIMRLGAGKLSVAAGAGTTLYFVGSGGGRFARVQYSVMHVRKIAPNTWVVYGDTAAS